MKALETRDHRLCAEWGGVQFKVSNATRLPNGDTELSFSEGGWQQARGANLHAYPGHIGNRYYLEGARNQHAFLVAVSF